MRSVRLSVFGVCVFAAACSGPGVDAPTSPTSGVAATAQLAARSGAQLPFRGSLTTVEQGVIAPPHLLVDGTAEGEATQLGRFTATFSVVADLATPTATGTFDFTAADGDHLVATFVGTDPVTVEPGVIDFTEVFTIVNGTGRFATATGTFTLRRLARVDFSTGRSTSSGSFDGNISLNE